MSTSHKELPKVGEIWRERRLSYRGDRQVTVLAVDGPGGYVKIQSLSGLRRVTEVRYGLWHAAFARVTEVA